jgi:prepilin-type N-terminal cleavage/methylation domain-containing protein
MCNNWKKRPGGFTLMELMVVVAIVAFVTAAVVPSFSLSLQRNRQREAGLFILQSVLSARALAARTGRCHRVRVFTSSPGLVMGGTGGVVLLEAAVPVANANIDPLLLSGETACAMAQNWNLISHKSVDKSMDINGLQRPGLVGNDVAIDAVTDNAGAVTGAANPVVMMFEPSGGQSSATAQERYFRIRAYNRDGSVQGGKARFVQVSASGAVKYIFLEGV